VTATIIATTTVDPTTFVEDLTPFAIPPPSSPTMKTTSVVLPDFNAAPTERLENVKPLLRVDQLRRDTRELCTGNSEERSILALPMEKNFVLLVETWNVSTFTQILKCAEDAQELKTAPTALLSMELSKLNVLKDHAWSQLAYPALSPPVQSALRSKMISELSKSDYTSFF